MSDLPLKLAIRGQLATEDLKELTRRLASEDRGEIGSWMILAAGLATAAVAAAAALSGWLGTKAAAITSN